jgi:23S rRNA (pseudouridine1915-N3)-methyltransferase
MKIVLCSIGKEDDPFLKNSIGDFTKRISHYYPVEWKIIQPVKNQTNLTKKALKAKEATFVLKSIPKDHFLVALDEKGTMLSSAKLAAWIQTRANESVKQLVFLIGGAYGLDEPVLKRANFIWSLSPLTFPHQLVRLMLTEQIYRACTINKNEKYHHA